MCQEIVTPLGIAGQQQGVGNRIQKQQREEGDAFGSRESMRLKHPERRVPCHPPAHMWSAHVVVEDPARRHLEQGLRIRNLLELRPIEFLPIGAVAAFHSPIVLLAPFGRAGQLGLKERKRCSRACIVVGLSPLNSCPQSVWKTKGL
jgi:hypothetical protein